jgi:hypothetical protein
VVFTLLGFLMFLITIANWKDLGTKDQFIVDFKANWKQKPLVDIMAVPTTRCPENYEQLINREFTTIAG